MSKNKELKKFVDISDTNIKKLGVQALSDRPNVSGKYGTSGLSSAELKAWFDRLADFIAKKINTMHATFASEEVAQYIRLALAEYDIEHLQDLIDAVMNGSFAEKLLMVFPTQNAEEFMPLQSAIYSINKSIADRYEDAYQEIDSIRKHVQDLGFGYTDADANFIEDGGAVGVDVEVVDDKDGKKLIFTLKNFGKGAMQAALDFPLDSGDATYSLEQKAPLSRSNTVISQSSVGFGENCISGCKGYYISEIYYGDASNSPQIRLATSMPVLSGLKISSSKLTASTSFTAPKYSTGAKFNITCGSHYFYIGTISSINKDVITFTGDVEVLKTGFQSSANSNNGILTSTSFHVTIPGIDDYTMCVSAQPTIGVASVSALSFTEGSDNKATGIMSHAEGRENTSGGAYSHTEGRGNVAGYAAHAEGYLSKATEMYAHAEGWNSKATAAACHAEGRDCEATAHRSHAEGWKAKATAADAHAEGRETTASAGRAHAEGYLTTASGNNSHSGGWGTIASAAQQTSIGQWNKESPDALFIVGNGTSNTARSNAFEVLKDGKLVVGTSAYSATDLTVGSSALPTGALFFVYE